MSTQVLRKESEPPSGEPASRGISGRRPDAVRTSIAVLAVAYLAQTLTPLRLDNDSVVYLRMAAAMADGVSIEPTGLPIGYPAMVALLDRIGLGSSFFFVLVNCAFIALGLYSVWYVFSARTVGRRTIIVPMTMLAIPLIRYLAMPLPESMFFGVSLAAIATMTAATRNTGRVRLQFIAVAVVLSAIAILVRLVGFALVPALLWTFFEHSASSKESKFRWTRERLTGGILVLAVIAVAVLFLGDSFRKYSYEFGLRYFRGGFFSTIYYHLQGFTWIFGEVVANLPGTKFRNYRLWFLGVGVIVIVWTLIKVRFRAPRTPAGIYLLAFIVLLLVWPYNALRLWAPIVPLLIGYAEIASIRFAAGQKWSRLKRVYIGWYALMGIAALLYTSRITFAGDNFSKVYGLAGGLSSPDSRTGKVDTLHNRRAIELMKRYGNSFQPDLILEYRGAPGGDLIPAR